MSTPSRRGFLGGIAALSAAAIPIAAQAANLDEWDQLALGMSLIHPSASESAAHARAAGMKPEWIYAMVRPTADGTIVLLFETPDKGILTFNRKGLSRSS